MSINTPEQNTTDFSIEQPDARGHFGIFGGRFVSETLTAALDELQETYDKLRNDPEDLQRLIEFGEVLELEDFPRLSTDGDEEVILNYSYVPRGATN